MLGAIVEGGVEGEGDGGIVEGWERRRLVGRSLLLLDGRKTLWCLC